MASSPCRLRDLADRTFGGWELSPLRRPGQQQCWQEAPPHKGGRRDFAGARPRRGGFLAKTDRQPVGFQANFAMNRVEKGVSHARRKTKTATQPESCQTPMVRPTPGQTVHPEVRAADHVTGAHTSRPRQPPSLLSAASRLLDAIGRPGILVACAARSHTGWAFSESHAMTSTRGARMSPAGGPRLQDLRITSEARS